MNLFDGEQRTALRAASWAGHLDCVKHLLEAGADINHVDSEGRTALIAACYMGHLACVRELIIWGGDIEVGIIYQFTGLIHAKFQKYNKLLKINFLKCEERLKDQS